MASSTVAGVSNWRAAFEGHPGLAVTPENYDRLMAAQAAPEPAPEAAEPAPEPEPEPVAAVEPEPAREAAAAPRTPPRPVRPSASGGA